MIDMPPEPPPAHVREIEQKLTLCGLKAGHFTVKYESLLQDINIVIDRQAGASRDNLACVREAAGDEFVTFRDGDLQKAYEAAAFKALQPKLLAEARAALEKRGLLAGFPERSSYSSDKLFAAALERHCGVTPGTFFVESQGGFITFKPSLGRSEADSDRAACLMSAMSYVTAKGEEVKFGFLGNEVSAPP